MSYFAVRYSAAGNLVHVVTGLRSCCNDISGIMMYSIKNTSQPFWCISEIMSLFQGLLTFCYISLLSAVGERVAARIRKRLFHSLITQDVAFFDVHRTGEIVNRCMQLLLSELLPSNVVESLLLLLLLIAHWRLLCLMLKQMLYSFRLTTDVQDFKSSFKLCISQGLRSFTQVLFLFCH